VPEKGVHISGSVFLWCSKVTFFFNFSSGPCLLLDFGQSFIDLIAYDSDAVFIKWNWGSVLSVDNA
jgi:hypothetical protein